MVSENGGDMVVAAARELARRAHEGQFDKSGRPYIEHVERVAAAVADDPLAEAVAWLHDVLEDCPAFRQEVCNRLPVGIVLRVQLLTRTPALLPDSYYEMIRDNPVALRVKLADIADNADEARLAKLDPDTAGRLRRKYAFALAALA